MVGNKLSTHVEVRFACCVSTLILEVAKTEVCVLVEDNFHRLGVKEVHTCVSAALCKAEVVLDVDKSTAEGERQASTIKHSLLDVLLLSPEGLLVQLVGGGACEDEINSSLGCVDLSLDHQIRHRALTSPA